MNEHLTATDPLTTIDREAILLERFDVIERCGRFAVLRTRDESDEQLWSVRDGRLNAAVAERLPLNERSSFEARHARTEARLWHDLVAAARLCSLVSDELVEARGSGASAERSTTLERAQSEARWALARAHRAYLRAATPPRLTLPATGRRRLLADWEANGRRCGICGMAIGTEDRTAIDHIIPVAHGGADDETNLRITHARCNGRRGSWIWQDEALPPVLRVQLERPHPSLSATFGCWFCGVPTRGYLDVESLPTLRLCDAHRGWPAVRALLAGYGVPERLLDQVRYEPVQAD